MYELLSYKVFAMLLIIFGLVGGQRFKLRSFEAGPIRTPWRILSIVMGLVFISGLVYFSNDIDRNEKKYKKHKHKKAPIHRVHKR